MLWIQHPVGYRPRPISEHEIKFREMCRPIATGNLSFFNKTYFQKNVSMYRPLPVLGHLETLPGHHIRPLCFFSLF